MAEYRNRSNGEIKTDTELRAANKNMSFPKAWNSSVHDALGVDPVLEAPVCRVRSLFPFDLMVGSTLPLPISKVVPLE